MEEAGRLFWKLLHDEVPWSPKAKVFLKPLINFDMLFAEAETSTITYLGAALSF